MWKIIFPHYLSTISILTEVAWMNAGHSTESPTHRHARWSDSVSFTFPPSVLALYTVTQTWDQSSRCLILRNEVKRNRRHLHNPKHTNTHTLSQNHVSCSPRWHFGPSQNLEKCLQKQKFGASLNLVNYLPTAF